MKNLDHIVFQAASCYDNLRELLLKLIPSAYRIPKKRKKEPKLHKIKNRKEKLGEIIQKRAVLTFVDISKARLNSQGDLSQQSSIPAVFVYMGK